MTKALLVLDFINDIVHPEWKLAWKWYSDFIKNHNTIQNLNHRISEFRNNNDKIIFVKVWFEKWYINQPKWSPLFGKANEFWVLELWTRWTETLEDVDYKDDTIVIKHRVSPFFETKLDNILKENNISELYLAWCSTDLVVESTAKDAHDRDYTVNVLKDCCVAANDKDHDCAIKIMSKFANILDK